MLLKRLLSTKAFYLLFFTAVLLSASAALGRDGGPARDSPPCGNPDPQNPRCKIGVVHRKEGPYAVYMDYRLKDAVAHKSVSLTITIRSPQQQTHNLKILDFKPNETHAQQIQIASLGDCSLSLDDTGLGLKKVCEYKADILDKTIPLTYSIPMKFAPVAPANGDQDTPYSLSFPLHVGVLRGGPLEVKDISECCKLGIRSGVHTLTLELVNNFRDYDVHLRKVGVKSIPEGLLGGWQQGKPDQVTRDIYRGRDESVPIELNTPSAFGLLLNGFTKDKGLKLSYSYEDAYQRWVDGSEYAVPTEKVRFSLSQPAWFLCMLIGVAVGTAIKFFRQRQTGSLRNQIIWALGTMAVGILVSVLSNVLEIGIDIKSVNISDNHPIGVIFIGLVGALGGIALLERLLPGIEKPASETSDKSGGQQ